MKRFILFLSLAVAFLAGCSHKATQTAGNQPTPVNGMSAAEVMAAHNVAAEVIPARATHKNDPGLQALDKQMAALASGLDSRTQLLMSGQTTSKSAAPGSKAADPTLQQRLEANATNLNSILASARASVDNVGDTQKRVAGMPAGSLQAGLRASIDRIATQLGDILSAPPDKAILEIAALRSRLTLTPLHVNNRSMPTISVRTIHP